MRKYDSYKNSGVEWIGDIPSHWKAVPMRFLLRQRITDGPHETPKFLPDGIPFLSVDGIQDGELVFEGCRKISIEDHERYKQKCVVEKHDILMGKAASVGKVAQVKVDFEFSIWSPLALLKPNHEKITSSYFEYFLKSTYAKDNANILSTFNTQQNISMTDIPRIYYIIPNSVEEQTAIAAYLDRKTAEIDELIADKKRLLELYEEEKTAIINQAVTKGINPDAPMKDSGIEWLGEIPEHWETSPLKYLGKFINGFSFKSTDFETTGVRVLKISNIQHMRIDWSDESFIDEIFYETHENFRVLENDLVFALTRPIISTGIKVALIDTTEPILLNQRNSIYRPTDINVKWFYYIILSSNFIQEFDSRIDKTGQQPNISSNDIGEIKITIPNEDEQYEIISFIDAVCSEIENKRVKTQKLIDLLTEYRTALISEVVTGKIKVIE
ncbi:hypothetical protein SDC9_34869 [bioreactor metagenome]|uniref:Type I restriction modification DNA specificity domain-containing protein n=1 Tax=bioreactor metagenome TaxID=1076179 RepID=A0A644VC36_9ZZZZ|nr:restriction endonuclease subunit S [Paludibacter sp.]